MSLDEVLLNEVFHDEVLLNELFLNEDEQQMERRCCCLLFGMLQVAQIYSTNHIHEYIYMLCIYIYIYFYLYTVVEGSGNRVGISCNTKLKSLGCSRN